MGEHAAALNRARHYTALVLFVGFWLAFAFQFPRVFGALMALGCFVAWRVAVRSLREVATAERREPREDV